MLLVCSYTVINDKYSVFQENTERVIYLRNVVASLSQPHSSKADQLHASRIKDWLSAVDSVYNDFSSRMDSYRRQLERTLGIQSRRSPPDSVSAGHPNGSAGGNSQLSTKEANSHQIREFNEEKRKSARKREYVLLSLLFMYVMRVCAVSI